MILSDVHQGIQTNRKPHRKGRGCGSGNGKTAGRGHNGAGSRRGNSHRPGFQGGQKQLFRLVAKRGFNNKEHAAVVVALNLYQLEKAFTSGDTVSLETLHEKGLVKRKFDAIKILGDGDLTHKLTVKVHRFSRSAEEKIRAAGGTVEVI